MTFYLRFRFKRANYVAAGVALGYLAAVHVARAEVNAAQASFDRGLESMRRGDYETACASLQQSYELERLLGVLFTLAECEAAWGKVATAIEHYEQFANELPSLPAERRANYEERRGIALQKIAALSAIVPLITIDVAGPAPAGLVIKRSGITLERASYGVSKPVDPREYEIVAEWGGRER
jgi:tetratricopeptide (TPR) repeat protein